MYKEAYKSSLFHQVSTDEVYGSLGESGLFSEATPYAPNSPYSASKASGDMLVLAYGETYGLNTVITNCSNNYGPKQHDEKLIPTIIKRPFQWRNLWRDIKKKRQRHKKGIYNIFYIKDLIR